MDGERLQGRRIEAAAASLVLRLHDTDRSCEVSPNSRGLKRRADLSGESAGYSAMAPVTPVRRWADGNVAPQDGAIVTGSSAGPCRSPRSVFPGECENACDDTVIADAQRGFVQTTCT